MKLRKQLLLVSLFIFMLPWAGCQYIREMETVLIDGQARAMVATAQAISAHLQTQPQLLQASDNSGNVNLQQQLYFHRLRLEPQLDGYVESWLLPTLDSRPFVNESFSSPRVSLFGGIHDDYAYLIFEITDDQTEYHDIQKPVIASGDHIVLRTVDDRQNLVHYYLRASGEGPFSARYINPQGQVRQEHRIRGYWANRNGGYTVEVLLPLRVLGQQLDFKYAKNNGKHVGNQNETFQPPPWVSRQTAIENIIAIYSNQQTRIEIVNPQGWMLGQAGSLRDTNYSPNSRLDWQTSFYRTVLGELNLQTIDNPINRGRVDSNEVLQALSGTGGTNLYRNGDQRVARTSVPVVIDNNILGAVVVEQSTDSLIAGTNSAFNQLFIYVGIAFISVFLGLFSYASILSLRIRRLSRAADTAIAEDGKINSTFIESKFGDEIGDLTRSYGQLLSRLSDYTDYLRTLASKLSHELRTPLAVVRSSLENLDQHSSEQEAQQYRQRAKEGAERLSNILSAMSSASQLESSIKQTPTENFPLDHLLTEVTEAYRSTYKNTAIELNIEKDQNYSMAGSPDLVVQMLDKLIDNASDYCPSDGSVRIRLDRLKNSFQLSVSNTGPLLPEHMQGQLFDSLVSVREGNDQKTHLGLGLYIVRLVVDFHKGQVRATNLKDESGVAFIINIPFK